MQVTLSDSEMIVAANVGVIRQVAALKRNLPDRVGCKLEDGFKVHIAGAMAEYAFCKGTGRHWPATVNTFRAIGDVGPIEVRGRSEHWHDLIIRPSDDDHAAYVLVTGVAPDFVLRGWILGGDGKRFRKEEHGGREAAHFVPQASLMPIDSMDRLVLSF